MVLFIYQQLYERYIKAPLKEYNKSCLNYGQLVKIKKREVVNKIRTIIFSDLQEKKI